jgi:hypothetical protein
MYWGGGGGIETNGWHLLDFLTTAPFLPRHRLRKATTIITHSIYAYRQAWNFVMISLVTQKLSQSYSISCHHSSPTGNVHYNGCLDGCY